MRVAIDSSRNPERTPKVLLVAQTRDAGRWMYGVGDGDEAERWKNSVAPTVFCVPFKGRIVRKVMARTKNRLLSRTKANGRSLVVDGSIRTTGK